VQGIDADLAAALGRKLGVRFTFVSVPFDNLINALKAGRIDVIISGMSATADRAKVISFVEYFKAGTSIVVRKAAAGSVHSLQDLCGRTVAVQQGTTQEELAITQRGLCGKQQLTVRSLPSGSQVLLQVKHQQADAALVDFPVAAYNAKVSNNGRDFAVVGNQIDPGPFGIGVRKEDSQLREVLRTALEQLFTDGTYHQILANWNVTDGAVSSAGVLGAP
jgi:polar amino acid transport system substrate-binding protein